MKYRNVRTGAVVRVAETKAMGALWQPIEAVDTQIAHSDDVPCSGWSKSRLLNYAQDKGLDINAKSSKAHILQAIENAELDNETKADDATDNTADTSELNDEPADVYLNSSRDW